MLCFSFVLQAVKEREPEWIKFNVRYCLGHNSGFKVHVILEPVSEDFLVNVSFDDVLITIDKTELV